MGQNPTLYVTKIVSNQTGKEIDPDEIVISDDGDTELSPSWDDVYVNPAQLNDTSVSAVRKQFKNDGEGGTDSAVRFIDNTGATGSMYTALENAIEGNEFTIEFWIKPERANLEYVIYLGTNCWVRLSSNAGGTRLYYDFGFSNFGDFNLNIGTWNHCILCVNKLQQFVRSWTNGQLSQDTIGSGAITADTDYYIAYEGSTTSTLNFQGTLDLITVYSKYLDDTQALFRYNNGVATTDLPSGVTDSDRVLYMACDDESGNTITNTKGDNATIAGTEDTDFEWVTGAVGISGSIGVYLPAFEPSVTEAVSMDLDTPHGWQVGTALRPHVHFSSKEAIPAGSKIVLAIEYTLAEPTGVYPDTTIDSKTITFTEEVPAFTHNVYSFDEIDMSTITKISPHMGVVFKRQGNDVEDTFTGDIFLINFGIHYLSDTIGSAEEFSKE